VIRRIVERLSVWFYITVYELIDHANAWRESRTGWASVPIPVDALRSGPVTIDVVNLDHPESLSSMPIVVEDLDGPEDRAQRERLESWFQEAYGDD
jgi:hypothetical protein